MAQLHDSFTKLSVGGADFHEPFCAFSDPVFRHVLVLMVGAILARGRHTVTAILRVMRPLATAHFSTYHRVLSRAAWSTGLLQRTLTRLVLELRPIDCVVEVLIDDSVAQHRGPKLYGRMPSRCGAFVPGSHGLSLGT